MDIFNDIQLHTLKWFNWYILSYIYFTIIFKNNRFFKMSDACQPLLLSGIQAPPEHPLATMPVDFNVQLFFSINDMLKLTAM